MFVQMSPQETGVVTENRYNDPRMWGERYREFEIGPMGSGVAIGDYDGDGRPDLFVVSKTESCRLFRNLGNWKFEDVTARAHVGGEGDAAAIWKQGATFADVNNDGLLDIYVCRFGAPNLLYVNQGDGTFKEEAAARGLAVNDASVMAAFCDYDRDGWLDVFVQTNLLDSKTHPAGQKNYLFRNNRDGTFSDVTQRAGITGEGQGHSATWWDFNEDGWPDLYVANDFAPADKLYRNNGDGTFTDVINDVVPHMPFSAMGSDLGDINNDGKFDLIVAEMAASTHQKDQRTMALSRSRLAEDPPSGVAKASQRFHNALYLNAGAGRCLEIAEMAGVAATDWTWSVRFEDLDNDGRIDLFATNGMHRESHNADLMARMLMAPTLEEKVRIERASPVLAEKNFAFRNRGDLQFEDVSAAWGLDQRGVSFGAAFGDLDGDGDLDLACTNFQAGLTLLRNDSDAGHRVVIALRGVKSNRFGVGATVTLKSKSGTQVRQLVLARGYVSSSEPVLHFGLGGDDRVIQLTIDWPSGSTQTLENLAADARYTITESDIAAAEPGNVAPTARLGKPALPKFFVDVSAASNIALESHSAKIDEFAQNPLQPLRFNGNGPTLAAGPLTRGGHDVIVVGGSGLDGLRILEAGADGRWVLRDAGAAGGKRDVNCGPVLLFDANGDGVNDVLVTKGGVAQPAGSSGYQPELYVNDGYGHLAAAAEGALPKLAISAGAAVASDFDHDGQVDVFIGGRVVPGQYPATPRSALLANRAGHFEDVTDRVAPALRQLGMVTGALWSDVDGDGWVDLLVTVEWGNVKYFHNVQGRSFEDWTEKSGFASAGTGWWSCIASADFNGDGHPDFIVGNLGLNSPYHANATHPVVLYVGDFKGDDTTQLIEGYYEGETLYPRRTRKELGDAIPAILKKYPRNDAYARATLEEVLGKEKIEAAQRLAATNLSSGVLLSNQDGSYRFEPLPRLAQVSPIEAAITGDFDGNGTIDIYAVQNSYAPAPSVGRLDSGLSQLLLGDGHGGFQTPMPGESGLVVPGDAKAVVRVDLDGDGRPDIVVARNRAPLMAFRNIGTGK